VRLSPRELVLLVNAVARKELTVYIPHLRAEALEVDLASWGLRVFEEQVGMLDGALRALGHEGPRLVDLLWDSLLSAGVILPRNVDELVELMEECAEPPSLRSPQPRLVALDTNVLYNATLTAASRLTRARPPLLISSCVLEELARQATRREPGSSSTLLKLCKARGAPQQLLQKLRGMPGLAWRRAIAALRERRRLASTYPLSSTPGCRRVGDYPIVRDYASFARARGCRVTLVTHDRGLGTAASALGLPVLTLEPPERRVERLKPSALPDLLYYMAVNFMAVDVRGEHGWARLWPWWRGAQGEELLRGELDVEVAPHLLPQLEGELEALRRVEAALGGGP